MSNMLATPANMRNAPPGTFAYDPDTGERYSATYEDYFWMPDDSPLIGSDGEPLVLASEARVVHVLQS